MFYDSDEVLFDSLKGVNCIFSVTKGGGEEQLFFFPNRYYLWKCVKKKIKTIQLQHLSRNINLFIAI